MTSKLVATVIGAGVVITILSITLIQYSTLFTSETPFETSSETSPIPVDSKESIKDYGQESNTIKILETNGEKHLIPLEKIRGGGPPKDGIPSIDDPKFVQAQNADFMSDSDVVIGLKINGDARAYPLFILVWHEIVNDIVGDVPVAVTYCPLCYTSQVFERIIDGQEVEFGTSGKLYNSNLLMYDRLTDSYWSQGLGLAVKGNLTGMQLQTLPFDVITWRDWKKINPDTVVLTTDTGHIRAYGVDPYGDYYTESRILFPVDHQDNRLPPKEIIVGLNAGNVYKAYVQKDIESMKLINDNIGNSAVLLVSQYEQNSRVFDREIDGKILDFEFVNDKLVDTETASTWNYDGIAISGPLQGKKLERLSFHPGFWFEWIAFHPDTLLYGDT